MKADLHIHTKESDGCLSVEDVMLKAAEQGLEALAVTDHDTTAGLERAQVIGVQRGIKVIAGVEISTSYKDEEIHLLAYYSDINSIQNKELQHRLKQTRHERTQVTRIILDRVQQLGIELTWPEVEREASPGGLVCKTHIMYAIQHKLKETQQTADWNNIASWFKPGGAAGIPYSGNSFMDTVDLVLETGGCPVLAHPGLIRNKAFIAELLAYKPIGLEVYYAYWEDAARNIEYFENICRQSAVLATGGSDYHGSYSLVGIGEMEIPAQCVYDLERFLMESKVYQNRK